MSATQENTKSVADYLTSLVWDGIPRIERWLIDLAGAEDTPHVRAAGRLMLVAAVRRARDPGCRFDQLPVLVGPQGSGKSSALRVLAVDEAWFADGVSLVDSDARHFIEATAGKWIVEASELVGMEGSERDAFKALLSRSADEARLAYQTERSRVPRSFVIVGTSGQSDDYLVDVDGGGGRRIVLVHVQRFDLDRLLAVRDQLWAEAAIAEASGEAIHLVTETQPS